MPVLTRVSALSRIGGASSTSPRVLRRRYREASARILCGRCTGCMLRAAANGMCAHGSPRRAKPCDCRFAWSIVSMLMHGAAPLQWSAPFRSPRLFPRHDGTECAAHGRMCGCCGGWAASAYAMRLAALLAAAAFGAGVGIARAYVTVRPGGLDAPVGMSLRFDRISFMSDVLPLIAEGALGADRNACDPAAVLALLNPADCSAAFSDDGFFGVAQPLDIGFGEPTFAAVEDDRRCPGRSRSFCRPTACASSTCSTMKTLI